MSSRGIGTWGELGTVIDDASHGDVLEDLRRGLETGLSCLAGIASRTARHCCFGGNDYIDDPSLNRHYQQTACDILRDDKLWSQSYSPYKQMRVWHYKGYDQLKKTMRSDFSD